MHASRPIRRGLWTAAFVATMAGCAGYQVGPRTLFRPQIRTVHVPIFESDSFRPHLGERLTEAVIKEIEKNTPYKVVSSPNADSVLVGRIVSERKRAVSEDRRDFARVIATNVLARVSWYDRRGDVIFQDTTFAVAPETFSVSHSPQFIPEVGQSVATSHQKAINRIAREIVGRMEAAW
jgi:hypothetical protein